ncbi:MAG: SLBB domain-containing protein [candidate division Zixibacteria bacterium]|nr:SLBB domain-containing protein [candidate division Zixibacteria bacterium]
MTAQPIATDSVMRPASLSPFDLPIDADKYLIRPGERLMVTPLGAGIPSAILAVDPEGQIIDPKMGIIDVGGKTLSEVRRLLIGPLSKQFRAERIIVSVEGPHRVPIRVIGAVNRPGTYSVFTSQHVSEVIALAGGLRRSASSRHIQFSGGPNPIRVDLELAASGESNLADPPLYAGLTVTVPYQTGEMIRILGEVQKPSTVEFVEGETVQSLISLAGGARLTGDLTKIDLSAAVHPGDMIVVPIRPDLMATGGLVVTGAVQRPGGYEFSAGTTIDQLLAKAGGGGSDANLSRAVIFRPSDRLTPGADSMSHTVIGGLRDAGGKFKNISLRPFDTLFIPRFVGWVRVSGQVGRPGAVPYIEGRPLSYYILAAGDFLGAVNRGSIVIRNQATGEVLPAAPESMVSDGDEILVPSTGEKP